jgi:branched-chain amino acid transport system substrate-binding protein
VRRRYLVAALVLGVVVAAGVLLAVTLDEKPEPVADTDVAATSTLPTVPAELDVLGERCGPLLHADDVEPDVALVFEAPLQAANRELMREYEALPGLVLDPRDWRAKDKSVGVFVCDGTTLPGSHFGVTPNCGTNVEGYLAEPSVVAQVQSSTSGCAAVQLPLGNGELALVSSVGTYDCLTRPGEGCEEAEPEKYQPLGRRAYLRLVAPDRVQAAALAQLAADEGLRRVYVLDDQEAYGIAVARHFADAAAAAGIQVVGEGSWDPREDDYRDLMRRIEATDPDAILLGGLIDENGGRVLSDKAAVLGPNSGPVRVLAPEGFRFAPLDEIGSAADDLLAASSGLTISGVPEQGRDLIAALEAETGRKLESDDALRMVHAAAALEVALDAIARSDGTRAGFLDAVFATRIEDGYTGPVGFDLYGDPTSRPIRIERADAGEWLPYRTIEPDDALVQAASG